MFLKWPCVAPSIRSPENYSLSASVPIPTHRRVRGHTEPPPVSHCGPQGQNLTSLAHAPPAHLSGLRTQGARQTHRKQKPPGCAGAPNLLPWVLSMAPSLGGTTAKHS